VADTLQIIGAVRGAGVMASDYEIAVSILPALKSYMRSVAMGDDDSKRNLIFQDFTVALTYWHRLVDYRICRKPATHSFVREVLECARRG
jgi:hypothetical protein